MADVLKPRKADAEFIAEVARRWGVPKNRVLRMLVERWVVLEAEPDLVDLYEALTGEFDRASRVASEARRRIAAAVSAGR